MKLWRVDRVEFLSLLCGQPLLGGCSISILNIALSETRNKGKAQNDCVNLPSVNYERPFEQTPASTTEASQASRQTEFALADFCSSTNLESRTMFSTCRKLNFCQKSGTFTTLSQKKYITERGWKYRPAANLAKPPALSEFCCF